MTELIIYVDIQKVEAGDSIDTTSWFTLSEEVGLEVVDDSKDVSDIDDADREVALMFKKNK